MNLLWGRRGVAYMQYFKGGGGGGGGGAVTLTLASSCLVHTILFTTPGRFFPVGGACLSAAPRPAESTALPRLGGLDFVLNSSEMERT